MFKIKLYKIQEVFYNHENDFLNFKLAVPYKRKHGTLVFAYQSFRRAQLLLRAMATILECKRIEESSPEKILPEDEDIDGIRFSAKA